MADSGVILPADAAGKALRTETQTTTFTSGAGAVVHQQVVGIGDPTTPANLLAVDANGRISNRVVGESITTPVPAAWTSASAGSTYVVNAATAGNLTFWLYNGGTVFSGAAPVVAFEQSPDNVNWAPLPVVRSDNSTVATQVTLSAMAANTALAFDAGMEGVAYARMRLITAPGAGTLAAYALGGGGFFEPSVSAVQQTLTKGVQGTQGVMTQDLKDSGRTIYTANGTVTPTAGTEALLSLQAYRAGATSGAATTTGLGVTTGKTLRIQTMSMTVRQAATAAIGGMAVRLRYGTGTLTVSSPMLATIGANIATATANLPASSFIEFPDGIELSGSLVFAVSILGTAHPVDVVVKGFEY